MNVIRRSGRLGKNWEVYLLGRNIPCISEYYCLFFLIVNIDFNNVFIFFKSN